MTIKPERALILSDLDESELIPADVNFEELPPAVQWQYIVEQVVSELQENEVPDKVIAATEYLIVGHPLHEVAKKVGSSSETIKGWLSRYPVMAKAVKYGQRNLHIWRLARMEQQFLDALGKSNEIVNLDLNEEAINPKILSSVGQHARFIINLYMGKKMDIRIHGSEDDQQVLNVDKEALQYLAEAVNKRDEDKEPVTATYRVLNPDEDTTPLYTEDGDPNHGEFGVVDVNSDGALCHICGKRVSKLSIHVTMGHKMKQREYESVYMLDKGALNNA